MGSRSGIFTDSFLLFYAEPSARKAVPLQGRCVLLHWGGACKGLRHPRLKAPEVSRVSRVESVPCTCHLPTQWLLVVWAAEACPAFEHFINALYFFQDISFV